MRSAPLLGNFNAKLDEWKKFDFTRAYRDDLGTGAFTELKELVQKVNGMLELIEKYKDQLSNATIKAFYEGLDGILSECNSLARAGDLAAYSNIKDQQQVRNRLYQASEAIQNEWPKVLAISDHAENKKRIEFINEMMEAFKKKSPDELIKEERETIHLDADLNPREQASFVKAKIDERAEKKGLAKAAVTFEGQADTFKVQSYLWLAGVILLVIGFVIGLICIVTGFTDELTKFQEVMAYDYDATCKDCNRSVLYMLIAKSIGYRVVMISFMLFVVGVAVKAYFAAMHNYTVFRHKTSAMNAALHLIDRGRTDQGKDALMNQAAAAIFSHQTTGFSTKPPDNLVGAVMDPGKKIKEEAGE